LIGAVDDSSSVNIEGQGWYLFGGFRNNLKTSQKLESLDSTWEEGPDVLEKDIDGQCVVQVVILNLLDILQDFRRLISDQ